VFKSLNGCDSVLCGLGTKKKKVVIDCQCSTNVMLKRMTTCFKTCLNLFVH
jgi:hypothetical protein